jgi:hypothetical protein
MHMSGLLSPLEKRKALAAIEFGFGRILDLTSSVPTTEADVGSYQCTIPGAPGRFVSMG